MWFVWAISQIHKLDDISSDFLRIAILQFLYYNPHTDHFGNIFPCVTLNFDI